MFKTSDFLAYTVDRRTNVLQFLIFTLFCFYIAYLYWIFSFNLRNWDIMPLTVWPLFFISIYLFDSIHGRFTAAMIQLEAQGAISLRGRRLPVLQRYLRGRAVRYAGVFALTVVAFNMFALVLSGDLSLELDGEWYVEVVTVDGSTAKQYLTKGQVIAERVTLLFLMVLAGYLAGLKLGLAVSYGTFLSTLYRVVDIRILPGHPDNASGLKPIGQFVSFQAILATIPAFWLAIWILIIPHTANHRILPDYTHWLAGFTSTLMLAVLISLLSFFLPLRVFNKQMMKLRDTIVRNVRPQLGARICSIYDEIETASEKAELNSSTSTTELSSLQAQLHSIETTPVWPLDPLGVIRFLTIVFVTFFIPIIQTYEQYAEDKGALQFFFIFFNAVKAFVDLFT